MSKPLDKSFDVNWVRVYTQCKVLGMKPSDSLTECEDVLHFINNLAQVKLACEEVLRDGHI